MTKDTKSDLSVGNAFKTAQTAVETVENWTAASTAGQLQRMGWESGSRFIVAHNPAYSTSPVVQGLNNVFAGSVTPMTYLAGLIPLPQGSKGDLNRIGSLISSANGVAKIDHDAMRLGLTKDDVLKATVTADDTKRATDLFSTMQGVKKDDKDKMVDVFSRIIAATRTVESRNSTPVQAKLAAPSTAPAIR